MVPGGSSISPTFVATRDNRKLPWIGASALLGALVVYRGVYYLLPFGVGVLLLAGYEVRPYAPQALGLARSVAGWVPRLVPQVLSGAVFLRSSLARNARV